MASAAEKELRDRVKKLEAALRSIGDRRRDKKKAINKNAPPGMTHVHTYGDMAMVPDEDEMDLIEIEKALKE